MFEGIHALPAGVRCRVRTGKTGTPDELRDVAARKAVMGNVYRNARRFFIRKMLHWRVTYHCGEEPLGSRDIYGDDDMAKVKSIAYHGWPPGSDMIKPVTPEGKTLIRTAKKQRAHEDKTVMSRDSKE